METRTIDQVKVYVLWMNPMTDRSESRRVAAISFDKEKLKNFYHSEKAKQPYTEDNWRKTFKNGSLLEWFNPFYGDELEGLDHFGHGIGEEWVQQGSITNDVYLVQ